MAFISQIHTQSASDVDISSALLVCTKANTVRIRKIFVNIFAAQVAGSSAYVCALKVQRAGAGAVYPLETQSKTLTSETEVSFHFGPITINATDVITATLLGAGGDTTTVDVIADINEELSADPVTLADGAHGGAATVITCKQIVVANADADSACIDITATGTGGASHGIIINATNGRGIALGSTNNNGISINSSAADAVLIGGGTDSDGVQIAGNGTGVDINADLSGTVTSVTNATTIADAVKAIVIESGITGGAGLTNDTGTQLTSITLAQAIAVISAAVAGKLTGPTGPTIVMKQLGKPTGNSRISAAIDTTGRTAVTLKVPD